MSTELAQSSPLVSVIIPTYDRPAPLQEAVKSAHDQTYDQVELIVVDDHSPTPAASVLGSARAEMEDTRIIRHETNRGANAARNTGIAAATGEFVAFLDDDDRWRPEKLERQVHRFLEADDDVGVVYTGSISLDANDTVVWRYRPSIAGNVTQALLCGGYIGSYSKVMVRASVIDEAGPLDERFPSWQDREWYLRLSRHCRFEYVPDPLVVRRFAGDQISDDFERKRDISYPLFLGKHRSLAAAYGPRVERQFVASLSLTLGASALGNGYYRDAVRYLLRSIRYQPLSWKAYTYLCLALGGRYTYNPARRLKRAVYRLTSVV